MNIKGKVAVVTGGAQSMGLLAAQDLVERGARVVIGDILDKGAEEVDKINEKAGKKVAVFQKCNVCDCDQLQQLLDLAVSEFGSLDILINNAGILDKPWEQDPTGETARKCIDINVRSLIDGTMRALRYWHEEEDRKGVVINLASVASYSPLEFMAAYTASKAAVLMYTKSLSTLAPKVRVNAVAPNWVDTNFIHADHIGRDHYTVKATGLLQAPEVISQIIRLIEDDKFAGDCIILRTNQEPEICSLPKATQMQAGLQAIVDNEDSK